MGRGDTILMSKGSRDRTQDRNKFDENFEKIFGARDKPYYELKNVTEEKKEKKKKWKK
jgi:hypothetical protein